MKDFYYDRYEQQELEVLMLGTESRLVLEAAARRMSLADDEAGG